MYEVTAGNLITMRPIVAKNPATMAPGAFVTYSYKLAGDTLWVTFQKEPEWSNRQPCHCQSRPRRVTRRRGHAMTRASVVTVDCPGTSRR